MAHYSHISYNISIWLSVSDSALESNLLVWQKSAFKKQSSMVGGVGKGATPQPHSMEALTGAEWLYWDELTAPELVWGHLRLSGLQSTEGLRFDRKTWFLHVSKPYTLLQTADRCDVMGRWNSGKSFKILREIPKHLSNRQLHFPRSVNFFKVVKDSTRP